MVEIPDVQQAWVVIRRGRPSHALELKSDWPVPKKLEKGEVLVKVQAAALNPIGWKLMRVLPNFLAKRPHVAEHDFSGVIVDSNGTEFSNGDPIYGWIPSDLQQKTRQGSIQQYLRVPVDYIVPRPPNVTPIQAAGITLATTAAHQALVAVAKVEAEQTVFINGGSTSVGAYGIQIAKAKGAKVVATASGKNEAFVKSMGADEFIDYTQEPGLVKRLTEHPPSTKYNIIYDAAGLIDPALYSHSAKYLAPNGIFISTGPIPHTLSFSEVWKGIRTMFAISMPAWLGNVNRRYALPMVSNNKEHLIEIQKLFAEGKLKPIVDSVYKFEDTLQAYDRILTTRATGKVVVKVDPTVE
ncbi:hypothetical protein NLJ89_g8070 [Agrocybe chaxingu]|uniref:Enoyl reductase (ER) domain-containing protein n=1 Tax=Agrocybe chaxingu TaxID=84603 RepID=A0A9W8JVX7_9AGAR|nr:hypothetical protein NLJ89_g8070 [Agrocybe chaxingu]